MLQVTRKDSKEALENMIRRFNRKVQQSGVLAVAKSASQIEKPLSKKERRTKAIIRKAQRADKVRRMRLGRHA
jgi:ribosomal protein S21